MSSASHPRRAPIAPRRGRRRYRVGIVGCGNVVVRKHLPAWKSLPDAFEVVAVADPVQASRQQVARLLGLDEGRAHPDWSELLCRDDVDVVDVCTPQRLRHAAVVDALDNGKHVLAEKPLGIAPAEAADIAERARASGLTVATTHNYLCFPEVAAARQIVDSGEIGTVQTVILNSLGVEDRPGTASYRPLWRHEREAGGGVLMDMLHGLYLAETFLGQPVRRVSAYVATHRPTAAVEDLALCRLETDESAALVNVAWALGVGGIEICGTLGRLSVRYKDGGTSPFAPVEALTVTTADGARAVPIPAVSDYATFTAVFADLCRSLDEQRPPSASAEAGLRVLELVMASYASAALERTVALPLGHQHPMFRKGVAGVAELDLPDDGLVQRQRLFGLALQPPTVPAEGSGA